MPRDGNDSGSDGGRRESQADGKDTLAATALRASTTDPGAKLFRKDSNQAAVLAYRGGQVAMENRSGLVVGALVTRAEGYGERAAALVMLDTVPGKHRKTRAVDKGHDTHEFIAQGRRRRTTMHVASHMTRWDGSAIGARTTRHIGYAANPRIRRRKRIEDYLGW